MSNENSLLARVLKSRYFPRSYFLVAQTGYQSSYAWRSLINARSVLERGMRWCIGDGKKVRIWQDPWLPELSNFKVWSSNMKLATDTAVAELTDIDTKQCKREEVFNNFNEFNMFCMKGPII